MTEDGSRCVITGLGLVCAIGNSVDEAWKNAVDSVSGIHRTTSLDTEGCYADLAAEVNCADLDRFAGEDNADRAVRLCRKAAEEAMNDASLGDFGGDPRACVIMGSCVGGAASISDYYRKGKDASCIPKMPISSVAPALAAVWHAGGTVTNVANACAAGAISIAYACELIRAGRADVVLAGGTDTFSDVPYSGFLSLHALDENGCSPFNRCQGITLGEGSGVLVVESYEHAAKRGAKIYCEVLGAGISSDAHHITAPREDGKGQMEAISRAIKNSGITAADIGYINAHGTGTALNDNAEFLSIHTIFDGNNDDLSVSSTKSMTGHCLGAAGAIEAVFSVKALESDTVAPTVGYTEEDLAGLKEKAGDIDFVANTSRKKELKSVMNNVFAFGGNNASVIFSEERGNVAVKETKGAVSVTGIGIITPQGIGRNSYLAGLSEFRPNGRSIRSVYDRSDFDSLGIKMSFYRKLDNFSKLQLISGTLALVDGGYTVTPEGAFDIGMIIGTSEGALGTCMEFQEHITEKGNAAGSAFKFPNTVYNAAGGYLSINSGIMGYNVTVTNGACAGLSAAAYAMCVLRSGQEKAMIATGTDENSDKIEEWFERAGLIAEEGAPPFDGREGFPLSDGSVSLLLEDVNEASNRGARVYAYITGYGMANAAVRGGGIKGSGDALLRAIRQAADDAGLDLCDIDAVYSFANGTKYMRDVETEAYKNIFGKNLSKIPLVTVKERCGEGRASSAALAAAHACLALSGEIESDDCAYLIGEDGRAERCEVKSESLRNVLVTACGVGGSYCALVISREA